jgi:hypothetical protein
MDDLIFLNEKLDEQLKLQTEKSTKLENEVQRLRGESTNIGDSSLLCNVDVRGTGDSGQKNHRRQISFDPKFLYQASPSQMKELKESLISNNILYLKDD